MNEITVILTDVMLMVMMHFMCWSWLGNYNRKRNTLEKYFWL